MTGSLSFNTHTTHYRHTHTHTHCPLAKGNKDLSCLFIMADTFHTISNQQPYLVYSHAKPEKSALKNHSKIAYYSIYFHFLTGLGNLKFSVILK